MNKGGRKVVTFCECHSHGLRPLSHLLPFLSEQYLLRRFTILAGESVAAVFHEGLFEGSTYSMHVQHVVRLYVLPEGRERTADCSAKLKAPILHSCKYVRQCDKKGQTVGARGHICNLVQFLLGPNMNKTRKQAPVANDIIDGWCLTFCNRR